MSAAGDSAAGFFGYLAEVGASVGEDALRFAQRALVCVIKDCNIFFVVHSIIKSPTCFNIVDFECINELLFRKSCSRDTAFLEKLHKLGDL
jgi:hypothetical protein